MSTPDILFKWYSNRIENLEKKPIRISAYIENLFETALKVVLKCRIYCFCLWLLVGFFGLQSAGTFIIVAINGEAGAHFGTIRAVEIAF